MPPGRPRPAHRLAGRPDGRALPGVRTVEYDGKRVTYASDGEIASALADLNRQIAGATGRVSVVRIQSSKGL